MEAREQDWRAEKLTVDSYHRGESGSASAGQEVAMSKDPLSPGDGQFSQRPRKLLKLLREAT